VVAREGGAQQQKGGKGGIKGQIIDVVIIEVDVGGNGNSGGVEGGRHEDYHQRRRTATQLLLPGREVSRECSHQRVGNMKTLTLNIMRVFF
jgi:hypothetical protein